MEPLVGSALVSLIGAATFRLVITTLLERLKEWQDHRFELRLIKVQDELAQKEHDRNLQALRVQSELGILTASLEKQFELDQKADDALQAQIKELKTPTGVRWLDAWNSGIRPALATVCIGLWVVSLAMRGWIPTGWDLELISATLGIFIGGRIHATGK